MNIRDRVSEWENRWIKWLISYDHNSKLHPSHTNIFSLLHFSCYAKKKNYAIETREWMRSVQTCCNCMIFNISSIWLQHLTEIVCLFNYIMGDGWCVRERITNMMNLWIHFTRSWAIFFLLIIHLMWHTVLRYVEYAHSSPSFYLFHSSIIFLWCINTALLFVVTAIFF